MSRIFTKSTLALCMPNACVCEALPPRSPRLTRHFSILAFPAHERRECTSARSMYQQQAPPQQPPQGAYNYGYGPPPAQPIYMPQQQQQQAYDQACTHVQMCGFSHRASTHTHHSSLVFVLPCICLSVSRGTHTHTQILWTASRCAHPGRELDQAVRRCASSAVTLS